MGITKALRSKAERICGNKRMENEDKRLKNIFVDNGYLKHSSDEEEDNYTHLKKDQGLDTVIKTLVLPYIPGLSEDIDVSFFQ